MNKLALLFFLLIGLTVFSQKKTTKELHQYTFEEVTELQKKEKRPVLIFLHTQWCKFCLAMKKNTFTNKEVIDILNKQFYFVSFDAECKQNVTFNNHTFKYKPSGANTGVHELATALTDKELTFPNTLVLSKKNEIIFQTKNFINAKTLIKRINSLKP